MKTDQSNINIKPTRFEENANPMLIAGLGKPFSADLNVPELWMSFTSQKNKIPNKIGSVVYGLCVNMGNEKQSEYICGIQVSNVDKLPDQFSHRQLPSQTYAVFEHNGHVSDIRRTIDTTNSWVSQSDYEWAKDADFFFERYGEKFDPQKGIGDIEIWIPVKIK